MWHWRDVFAPSTSREEPCGGVLNGLCFPHKAVRPMFMHGIGSEKVKDQDVDEAHGKSEGVYSSLS